jgi:hypothetical protein
MDSTTSLKVKTSKGKGVGVRSLAHITFGVKGVLKLRDEIRKIDKHFTYSHEPTQTKQQVG